MEIMKLPVEFDETASILYDSYGSAFTPVVGLTGIFSGAVKPNTNARNKMNDIKDLKHRVNALPEDDGDILRWTAFPPSRLKALAAAHEDAVRRLRAFLKGLEVQGIDDVMEWDADKMRTFGQRFAATTKARIAQAALRDGGGE